MGVTRSGLSDDEQAISDALAAAFAEYVNSAQIKDENGNILTLEESSEGIYQSGSYYDYLKGKYKDKFTSNTYLFASQKMHKPYNPRSVYRIFSGIYKKFFIHAGTHMGRHIYITKLIDNGINPFIVQKLANHRSLQTTQRYYNSNTNKLQAAVNTLKF